tara:strand:- start:1326 stop:1652 length:327 start_codon:yes stop_codon:yes gene_type:complete
MAKEDRKYVIIPIAEVENIDFSQVAEDSARTLRLSEDGEYTFVKFEGDTPAFLEGKTQYTHAEIKTILIDPDGVWYVDNEEAKTWEQTIRGTLEKITWKSLNPFNWFS